MSKPKTKVFEYSESPDPFPLEFLCGDSPTFEPPITMKTREGSIIFFQAYKEDGPYGVIPGLAISKPRKAPGRKMMLVKVHPLSSAQQKKYQTRLRGKLRGPLNFWQ